MIESDKENVCVCCVGMSTVNKSSSKAAVMTPIVESSLELQKRMSPGQALPLVSCVVRVVARAYCASNLDRLYIEHTPCSEND